MITPVLVLPPEPLVVLAGPEAGLDELIVLIGPGVASGSPIPRPGQESCQWIG